MAQQGSQFSPAERTLLLRLAQVAMPAGQRFAAPDERTINHLEQLFAARPPAFRVSYRAALGSLRLLALGHLRRPLQRLDAPRTLALLQRMQQGGAAQRLLLRVLLTPLKLAHYDDEAKFATLGCRYGAHAVVAEERPRYLERTIDASDLAGDEELEADVVVVGSGAGGAVVAAELAQRGVAVVLLEEGGYFRRPDFNGRALQMMALMYRDQAMTGTLGNCFIPVPLGRTVGGTTTINSGTCYRTPARVLRRWREELGLEQLTEQALEPCFAKVEQVIGVQRADPKLLGGVQHIVARGCDALGLSQHGPLLRNAPDCDGSSLCCFGCPTDAKRSTNVSYVPLALRYGAQLVYNARVERIRTEAGRAVGVAASTPGGATLRVRARATVLSCGAIGTPTLLMRCGLAGGSGRLGRNLSIHPAVAIFGHFPQDQVAGCCAIPQGYGVEQLHSQGLLLEGAFVPPDLGAASITSVGREFTATMEAYEHLACMGVMIGDTSRGRVRLGPGGRPLMSYWLNQHDLARLKRGMEVLARIFLAAGAERVHLQLPDLPQLTSARQLAAFRAHHHRARDLDLTAHHPLGTARMGRSPHSSVVGPNHEVHDLPGLYICDGAAVPSSLGVNPMVTIMALCTRAAGIIAQRLDG